MLTILSMSVLVWLFMCWCLFRIQTTIRVRRIRFHRHINGRDASKCTLRVNRIISVGTHLSATKGKIPAVVTVRDQLPYMLQLEDGRNEAVVDYATQATSFQGRYRVLAAGTVNLPGIHLDFMDPQGLFLDSRSIPGKTSLRCLPEFESVSDARPSIKRINSLPQHGIHRLQRAGLGSELLELREYQPGDPPKSIAWKISARRNKLMTRQYESEVPVRINLLIDGSAAVRIGGYGNREIDQINYVAASIVRGAVSAGDLVGLLMCDGHRTARVRPSGGERGFYQSLEALSDFAASQVNAPAAFSTSLVNAAAAVCRRRYPELMNSSINKVPFTWLPVLPWNRSRWQVRVRLAGVLGYLYGLTPTTTTELFYDDAQMAGYAQRLLIEDGWPRIPPVVQITSSPDHASVAKSLAKALAESVARAHDNEVFVVLSSLMDQDDAMASLIAAAKVAMARHHRVVFVSSTPPLRKVSPAADMTPDPETDELEILRQAEALRIKRKARQMQRELRRTGACVTYAGDRRAVSIVLAEAELAGSGRTLTRSSR